MGAACIEIPRWKVRCDTTYQQIFNEDEQDGGKYAVALCRHQALAMLNRYRDRQTAASRLIQARVEECRYLSIKSPENVTRRQMMMVVSLAIIASYDPYDEMVKAALLRAKRISYAAESLHKVAYSAYTGLSRKGIQKIDPALLRKVNTLLGCNFISKNGYRSTINLTKLVGYTRDQLISAFDGYITQYIAYDAMQRFFPELKAA